MTPITASSIVFNVVWTGRVFDFLSPFVASQIHHSSASFRFIANACPPDQLVAMEAFAAHHPGRVVEVHEVSTDVMLPHGVALDRVLQTRDDGEFFALIDPDIVAREPFLGVFRDLLGTRAAVTSGKEVWSTHNIKPAEHPGVNGEYFFDQDGFTFGSPHFAIYRSKALRATAGRWDVGFGSKGNDISVEARTRLGELGRDYWVYDTGKIVNILLQGDGHELIHQEHPALVHIGGVSHFLAPPSSAPGAQGKPVKWGEGDAWGQEAGTRDRYIIAHYSATVLEALGQHLPAPQIPVGHASGLENRLILARTTLIDLVKAFGSAPGQSPASSGYHP